MKVCKFTADIGWVPSHSDNTEEERDLNWIPEEKIEGRVAISLKIMIWRKGNTLWILTLYWEIPNFNRTIISMQSRKKNHIFIFNVKINID